MYDVVVKKSSRSLSHLLMSFLFLLFIFFCLIRVTDSWFNQLLNCSQISALFFRSDYSEQGVVEWWRNASVVGGGRTKDRWDDATGEHVRSSRDDAPRQQRRREHSAICVLRIFQRVARLSGSWSERRRTRVSICRTAPASRRQGRETDIRGRTFTDV